MGGMCPPCKNCLLVTICRHRSYHMLVENCSIVYNYLAITEDEIVNNDHYGITEEGAQFKRIAKVQEILNPTRWRL